MYVRCAYVRVCQLPEEAASVRCRGHRVYSLAAAGGDLGGVRYWYEPCRLCFSASNTVLANRMYSWTLWLSSRAYVGPTAPFVVTIDISGDGNSRNGGGGFPL